MKIKNKLVGSILLISIMASLIPVSGLAQNANNGENQEPEPAPIYQESENFNLFLPTVAQPPSHPMVMGVEMDSVREGSLLDLASQANVKWVRRNGVFWDQVERTEGIRDWSLMADLENEMALLHQNGMELVLIVRGVPEWARAAGGHVCGPIAQNKYGAFASFMNELVRRYSRAPYYVKYWELGNEPDAPFIRDSSPFGCWGGSTDTNNYLDPYYGGGQFGKMLKAVYPSLKAADPDAQVLVGGLLLDCDPRNPPSGKDCRISNFLEGILRESAGDSFDGVSFHSYDWYGFLGGYSNPNWNGAYNTTGPVLDIKANFLYQILERYGKSDKYLLLTETALICDNKNQNCGEDYETTKAIYAAQTYTKSLISRVKSSIWYSYTNPWGSTNLIQSSNPTPAYYAFQTVSEQLSNTIFRQKIAITGISAYEFTRNGDRVWIAWSLDGQDHSLRLSNPPIRMWDLYGSSLAVGQNITIGMLPVYLEWDD